MMCDIDENNKIFYTYSTFKNYFSYKASSCSSFMTRYYMLFKRKFYHKYSGGQFSRVEKQ